MTLALRLILAALAVYRLAQLLAVDEGPLRIFLRLRDAIGRRAASERQQRLGKQLVANGPWKSFADGINCPYCTGIWCAVALTPLVVLPTLPGDLILIACGLAGAQTFLHTQGDR